MAVIPAACRAVEEDLSALIDEELAPGREQEVRAHLERCERCARRLEELCNVDLALASLPAPEISSELRLRLAARLAGDASTPARRRRGRDPSPAPRRSRSWLARRVAGLAALAAAVVLALYVTLRSGGPSVPDPSQVAQPSPAPGPEQLAAPPAQERAAPLLAERAPPEPEPSRVARHEAAAVAVTAEEFESLPEEDLALLFVLDDVEDLDVIANLELLERLAEAEARSGAG